MEVETDPLDLDCMDMVLSTDVDLNDIMLYEMEVTRFEAEFNNIIVHDVAENSSWSSDLEEASKQTQNISPLDDQNGFDLEEAVKLIPNISPLDDQNGLDLEEALKKSQNISSLDDQNGLDLEEVLKLIPNLSPLHDQEDNYIMDFDSEEFTYTSWSSDLEEALKQTPNISPLDDQEGLGLEEALKQIPNISSLDDQNGLDLEEVLKQIPNISPLDDQEDNYVMDFDLEKFTSGSGLEEETTSVDFKNNSNGSPLEKETTSVDLKQKSKSIDFEETTTSADLKKDSQISPLEEETTNEDLKHKSNSPPLEGNTASADGKKASNIIALLGDEEEKEALCKQHMSPAACIKVNVKFEDFHMTHDEKLETIREGYSILILISNLTPQWIKDEIENTASEAETEILYCNAPYIEYCDQYGELFRRTTMIITQPEIAEELNALAHQLVAGVPFTLYGTWF
ncbi:uncharacterized protein DMAD_00300 [Drosophila madeirensis]|uniref:Uncharacterized protein n=1 Tax=Drosophila madeirensis TaxID=30013 RepID=A0AAU9FXD2_DROMD